MAESTSHEAQNVKEKSILDELAHSETVRKLIECPVCLELPLPPIYLCHKGHIVCNSCQARTYACPLCREHYSCTRGFVAEGLIEKCILPCKYVDNGCPLTMRGAVLVEHVEVCDYRPVKCADCSGKLIEFIEYEDHLLKHHRINGIHESKAYVIYSMNLGHQIGFGEKCNWPQYYLKAHDVTFLLRLYATHWFVCAWISLLGPKNDCSKFDAMLEFHPTDDDTVVHTWQGPVNHFRDDPAKDIFLRGKGLITPMETLLQMAPIANEHAEWLYNIAIQKHVDDTQKSANDTTQAESENPTEETLNEDDILENELTEAGAVVSQENNDISNDCKAGDALTTTTTTAATVSNATVNESPQSSQRSPKPCFSTDSPQRLTSRISSNRSVRALASMDTPRLISLTPTPRRINFNGQSSSERTLSVNNTGSANVVTSRPATISQSASVLAAAAATVTSVLPTSSSLMSRDQNSTSGSSSSAPIPIPGSMTESSSPTPITVSTLRSPSARLLSSIRRSPFSHVFRSDSYASRAYSFEEDWMDYASVSGSASDDE